MEEENKNEITRLICVERNNGSITHDNLNNELLIEKLKQSFTCGSPDKSLYHGVSPAILADYIEEKHHPYLRRKIEQIRSGSKKRVKHTDIRIRRWKNFVQASASLQEE